MAWNIDAPSTYRDLLHCVYPFLGLRSVPCCNSANGTDSTNKLTFGTQRGPGEHFLGHPLTSICHDSSIADRVLAALSKGLAGADKLESTLPFLTRGLLENDLQPKPWIHEKTGALIAWSSMLHAIPTEVLEECHDQPVCFAIRSSWGPRARLSDSTSYAKNASVFKRDRADDREKGGRNGIPNSYEEIKTVAFHIRMADELEACYFGEDGLESSDPLDLRLMTVTGEPRELQGGCALAAMLALHIQLTKHARFGIVFGPPYFVLVELVVVDGSSHLLVGDLHSIVLDPEEPRATVKPFLAILLALFMDHCDDYHIEGPVPHILDQIAVFSRSLDRTSLAHDKGPRSEQPSDLPASSQSFCRFGESIVTANHFPGRAIICDANALPNSRMLASPIELEAEMAPSSDTPASSSPSALPSARKKICLDSDASHRSKLATTLPRAIQLVFNRSSMARAEYCPGPLLDLDSTPSLRLDLVRRVGHGATSVVWEAEWVTRVAASWQPEISCAEEGPSPSPRTGTPLATTPATTPISTPVTTPASMWDPSNTPYTSPASSTNSAVDGSSPPRRESDRESSLPRWCRPILLARSQRNTLCTPRSFLCCLLKREGTSRLSMASTAVGAMDTPTSW
ncbi:hypothetical protein MVLG_06224 [Microbotryum lychnidis-dioicae p1A1 Lamole]|uniref:Uncharacterized protein n=1 Tax=Microbotryum lychnidis-dioicae (strain p1A1 Lamole / MvSl-1064) TaxID=683840 RepID=U5HGL9_USTV1|nr:hypothetical protein MVLG_06224 [Microbotryum lychnidis-dioicae p1A1 Lamole]|eukprot:KDE03294.1 hypothetical protein MVLG_06224 [Microbotryum lychnidis-dioicae p1A1 Lamole]